MKGHLRARLGKVGLLLAAGWLCFPVAGAGKADDLPLVGLLRQYLDAVSDAADPAPGPQKICHTLTTIVPENRRLRWKTIDGKREVLMVTWKHDANGFLSDPDGRAAADVWVTAVPDLQEWCAAHHPTASGLDLRLLQLLGLPPTSKYSWFVEMWVDPGDLIRPAPDREVTDQEAEPGFDRDDRRISAPKGYVKWFHEQEEQRYRPTDGQLPYPWTRLGYTYDWGSPAAPHVGLSEFVLRKGRRLHVRGVIRTADYCLAPPAQPE